MPATTLPSGVVAEFDDLLVDLAPSLERLESELLVFDLTWKTETCICTIACGGKLDSLSV